MIFLTYLAIVKTFELLDYIAEKMGYCSVVEEEIPFVPFGWVYHLQLTIYLVLYLSRVTVPMGGSTEVYTSIYERTEFNYANVRKATYRGSNSMSLDFLQ